MWEGRRTCGKAGGHVGRWEDMWEGGRTCGKAGGHVGRREDRWEGGRTCGKAGGHVGRREDMWEGGRTCGKVGGHVGRQEEHLYLAPVSPTIMRCPYARSGCQGLSNPTPAYRLTRIYRPSLGNHQPIRPELRSSGRSRFPIHTLRAFIQTLLRQVCLSS